MSILFQCPSCGQTYDAGEHLAGKGMRCRSCSAVMRVPTVEEPSRRPAAKPGPPPVAPSPAPKPAPKAAVPPVPPADRTKLPPMPEFAPWDPDDDDESSDDIPYAMAEDPTPAPTPPPARPSPPPVRASRPDAGPPEPLKRMSFDTPPKAPGDPATPSIPQPRRRKEEVPTPSPEPAKPASGMNAQTLKLVAALLFVVLSLTAVGRVILGGGGGADDEEATIEVMEPNPGAEPAPKPSRRDALAPSPKVADQQKPAPAPAPPRTDAPSGLPERGAGVEVEPGVVWHRIELSAPAERFGGPRPATRMNLWLYLPLGSHAPGSLPCILIAPGGGTMLTGSAWSTAVAEEGRSPEHLPFVRAGFAVMGYEIDGAVPADFDQPTFVEGVRRFLAARAGLENAHVAMEYLAAKVPEVDRNRIYAVGHGSAGTTALVVAANEPGIAGCVAFAPCVDIKSRYQRASGNVDALIADLERTVPGANALFTRYSPMENLARVPCPVLLFHARDDRVVPFSDSELATQIGQPGRVDLLAVASGGHDEPMIRGGIEAAIRWLTEHGANPVPPASGAPALEAPAAPSAGATNATVPL